MVALQYCFVILFLHVVYAINPSDWNPTIKLVNAFCDTFTVEAACPPFSTKRSIEFQLFAVKKGANESKSLITKQCSMKPENIVTVNFPIDCKNLYYVSVSFSPDDTGCDAICSSEFQSSMWLLGDKNCIDGIIDDCPYDKNKIAKNQCKSSATKCNSTIQPWSPNIKMIEAFCSNVTVEATCPSLRSSMYIEFSLINIYNEKLVINTRRCKSALRNVRVTLTLSCRQLYQIEIRLRPSTYSFSCENCSMHYLSPIWLLGEGKCDGKDTDDCGNTQNVTNLNHCKSANLQCKKKNVEGIGEKISKGIIVLIVVLVVLFIGSIFVTIIVTRNCFRSSFGYQRTSDNVLVFNPSDL